MYELSHEIDETLWCTVCACSCRNPRTDMIGQDELFKHKAAEINDRNQKRTEKRL